MANKIKFGLRNVHYSVITDTGTAYEYATPVSIPGAVSISLTANGEISEFFADDIVYFGTEANNGYDGDLEMAYLPDSFAQDVLGQTLSTNGLLVENADTVPARFALTFEIQGDEEPKRYVLYNCLATRPNIASNTRGNTIEPLTATFTLQARAHAYTKNIQASISRSANEATFEAWNTTITEPTV